MVDQPVHESHLEQDFILLLQIKILSRNPHLSAMLGISSMYLDTVPHTFLSNCIRRVLHH